MPKRKRTGGFRKYVKRRRRYTKARRKYRKKRVGNWLRKSPLPTKFKFVTRYVETDLALDPGLSTAATYTFRLSSLFDPNYTDVGHQPIGFDQMMLMYNHYTVVGTKVIMKFANTSNHPQRVVAYLGATAAQDTDTDKIIENGLSRSIIVGEAKSNSTGVAVFKTSHAKFFGKKIMQDDQYQGTIGTNPQENVYLHLQARNMDPDTDPAQIFFDIRIQFVAILTEPKILGQS